MNRADRRASAARSRRDRVAAFAARAGAGGFETSLMPAGEHRGQDGNAVMNWLLLEPAGRPTCFCCRATFTSARRPGAFLTATASRAGPQAGIAVAGICAECWNSKTPEAIEAAAIEVMRRQLGAGRFTGEDP